MSGYNPNASMLPASNGGNIVAMSGGGLVFANGGAGKKNGVELPVASSSKGTVNQTLQATVKGALSKSKKPVSLTAPSTTEILPKSALNSSRKKNNNPSQNTSTPEPITITTTKPASASTPPSASIASSEAPSEAPSEVSPTPVTPPNATSEPTIDDVLQKLTESKTASKKAIYTPQEQDTILKNLATLLASDSKKFTIEVNGIKEVKK